MAVAETHELKMGFEENLVADITKITRGGLNAYYLLGFIALFAPWVLLLTIG
jgi:hypothetical protein